MGSAFTRTGRLEDESVPKLLTRLHQEGFTGEVHLNPGHVKRQIRFNEGFPIAFESGSPAHSLVRHLQSIGELTTEDVDRIHDLVRRHKNRELVALVRLELLEPDRLIEHVRTHTWRGLEECFGWHRGSWQLSEGRTMEPALRPLHTDPYPQIQRLLARHWSLNRIVRDLAPHSNLFTSTNVSFTGLRARLEGDPATQTLLAQLDGTHTLGELLGTLRNSSLAFSTLWLLKHTGCLRFCDTTENLFKLSTTERCEIEITGSSENGGLAQTADPEEIFRDQATPKVLATETSELRAEIERRIALLPNQNHYEVLGVSRHSDHTTLKRAYLRAAKHYHPDTMGRHDLDSIGRPAARLFSRIAEAWEALRSPSKRSEYDQRLEIDTADDDVDRIARAETYYRKGEILLRKGDFSAAERFLRPAVDLWPVEGTYRSALGWALYKKTPCEPQRALETLAHALESKPDDAITHFRTAIVQRALGENENATKSFARARELDPEGNHTNTL